MENVLPELALQAQHKTLDTQDKITVGIKDLLQTNEVHFYTSFAFEILYDIHPVLDDEVFRPFEDLKRQMSRLQDVNMQYMRAITDNKFFKETYAKHQQAM